MEVLDGQGDFLAEVISIKGEVECADEKFGDRILFKKLKEGQRLGSFCALRTREDSFVQLLLADNSLVYVGASSYLTLKGILAKNRYESFDFHLGRGKLRILSYKKPKRILTSLGTSELTKGEFIWDVYEVKEKLKTELLAISGTIKLDGKEMTPDQYQDPPEKSPQSASAFGFPHILYFGQSNGERSYDIAFEPKFPSRALASKDIEDVIIETNGESLLDEEVFEPVKGEIWVHDIVYDEAVRIIERESYRKAYELVPVAMREASRELVWEVASRSVLKWGVKFAKGASNVQVPLAVQGSYLGKRKDATSFYEKDAYKKSTEDIAKTRIYRAAKVAVLQQGYEKGWMEAKKYADFMLPKIVVPIVSKKIYDHVKPLGQQAVKNTINESSLVYTENVDRLVEHLSQVASKKYTQRIIDELGPRYTKLAAQRAAREASRTAAEEIASYMARTSSKRAGKLMGDLLARERARKIASEVAQEAKNEEAESSQKRSRRLYLESQR